jgi:hypothetical protein
MRVERQTLLIEFAFLVLKMQLSIKIEIECSFDEQEELVDGFVGG